MVLKNCKIITFDLLCFFFVTILVIYVTPHTLIGFLPGDSAKISVNTSNKWRDRTYSSQKHSLLNFNTRGRKQNSKPRWHFDNRKKVNY